MEPLAVPITQGWFSRSELAALLEIPLSEIDQLVEDGELPVKWNLASYRISRDDLFGFLEGNDVSKMVPVSQVAKHLGVTADTVREWCHSGKLKYIRVAQRFYLIDTRSIPSWPKPLRLVKPDWSEQRECVYFIQDEVGGLVKIGYTSGVVRQRVHAIELGIDRRCRLVVLLSMKGPRLLERHMHEQFAGTREKGEWFRPTPQMAEFITYHGGDAPKLEH